MFYAWVDDKEKLQETLGLLNSSSPALWGRMDAQQMVEHLIVLFEISNKKQETLILTPEKHLNKSQAFLMSEDLLPKNFVAKFLPINPSPYKYSSLQEAVSQLIYSLDSYQSYWKGIEEETLNHPVFGKLNKVKWNRVHNKHIQHHFLQFGLVK
jgi:hydroxymethylglutaryl-CoA reductase